MDETPEELEQIRREAEQIDPYRYRKRLRAFAAVGIGALGAGVVWLVLEMTDKGRNQCDRVKTYFCAKDPKSLDCTTYADIAKESVEHEVEDMRRNIRAQCERKIQRLAEDGIKVP